MQKAKDTPLTSAMAKAFWARVQRDEETGCLFWMGGCQQQGYGVLSYEGKKYPAHRVGYCLHYGVANLPDGYELDHLCCVPPCVEWSHLDPVTASVNNLRGKSPALARARRRTHCPRGHLLEGENVIVSTQGKGWVRRRCRACWVPYCREKLRRWRRRHPGYESAQKKRTVNRGRHSNGNLFF